MNARWRSARPLLILLLVSIGVAAAAFAARMLFFADVVPVAWEEEPRAAWVVLAAFALRALENIGEFGALLVVVAAVVSVVTGRRGGCRSTP